MGNQTQIPYFWLQTNGHWKSNLDSRTQAIINFTELLIKQTWTSNKMERVHLLVITLKHPISNFERTSIEHPTWLDLSLLNRRNLCAPNNMIAVVVGPFLSHSILLCYFELEDFNFSEGHKHWKNCLLFKQLLSLLVLVSAYKRCQTQTHEKCNIKKEASAFDTIEDARSTTEKFK